MMLMRTCVSTAPPLLFLGLMLLLNQDIQAHGPTICVGMITRTTESASMDLRVGVGLFHKQLDPDDNATVTDAEWTSSVPTLKTLLQKEMLVRTGTTDTQCRKLELTLTNGGEVRVLADFPIPAPPDKPALMLPFLARLPGIPPAIISVWEGEKMVSPPSMLWFGKRLELRP